MPDNLLLKALVALLALSLQAEVRAAVPYVVHCGGSSDVSQEVQNALYDGYKFILFTSGDCKMVHTVKITNEDGVRIEGAGRNKTKLHWYGPWDENTRESEPMFSIQNSRGVEMSNLGICVERDGLLTSAIDIYNACHDGWGQPDNTGSCDGYDPATAHGSHGNSFHDIHIGTCRGTSTELTYGIRILLHPDFDGQIESHNDCGTEQSDCMNDGHVFNEVHVTTVRDAAFVIEGQRSVGHVFRHVHCKAVWGVFEDADGFPNEAQIGNACIRTGRVGLPGTSGSFSWYGGLANGFKEAVFEVGPNPEKITISGVYTERAKALLIGNDQSGDTARPGGVHIEGYDFSTWKLNEWNTGNNPDGTIIDLQGVGPLTVTSSWIGKGQGPHSASICWSDPLDDSLDISSFEFTGNAIGSTMENVFAPRDECIYPTRQQSNLVSRDDKWRSMPEPYTDLDTVSNDTFSVSRHPTGHTRFHVDGTGDLACLEDGYQGQRIILVGDQITNSVTIQTSIPASGWTGAGCHNIHLKNSEAYTMHSGDVLMLVKGDDLFWHEIGRSELTE